MLSVVKLNVIMLGVVMPNVIVLSVVTAKKPKNKVLQHWWQQRKFAK
jgi:hypothetical protein